MIASRLYFLIFTCISLNVVKAEIEDVESSQNLDSIEAIDDSLNQDNQIEDIDCMEFSFGCSLDTNPITIYVVPSCLHCGTFLAETLDSFLKQHGQLYGVKVKFIIASAKDLFILKLFYNKFKNDKYKMYWKYIDYIKRAIATIKSTKATEEQLAVYKGSKKDSEFIKFEVIANNFGFSDEEIVAAYPKSKEFFESRIMAISGNHSNEINEIEHSTEIETPYITRNNQKITNLEQVLSE